MSFMAPLSPTTSRDMMLFWSVLVLSLVGLVAMGSASMEYAEQKYGDSFYHIQRHCIYLLLGVVVAVTTVCVPHKMWEQYGWVLLLIGFALLIMVLVPGVGREVNGSQRWLSLGPLTLQASELAKLFAVVYVAGYLVRRTDEVRQQWSGFLKPMAVMAMLIVLLLAEPDFGAAVVLMGAVLGMIFLGGVRLTQFFALLVVCGGSAALMVMTSEYRMRRLVAFTDPWAEQFSSGYQLVQSLIAFGRGEILGVGLGNSVQKLFYLPEAHTDFVFAIWAEEMGAVGAIAVLALFGVLVVRILWVGRKAELCRQPFAAYVCYGAALLIAGQVFINVGVNTGMLPTKGLTLPFFSYGGSSLLAIFMLIGLVLRTDYEVRHAPPLPVSSSKRRGQSDQQQVET